MINLLSDTITRPTPGMLKAMMQADVGDDVFGEDPSINRLESMLADWFGMEAGMFCPSGTMTNQIALKMHTRPLDEVVCDVNSHIYQYEVGGYAFHSGIGIQLLEGQNGKITAEQIEAAIRPDQNWLPKTRLVVLENTCNRGGGSIYRAEEVQPIRLLTAQRGLALHLDGARLFNALVETGESPSLWGSLFDSISICLSKGLGAPVGSVLLGNAAFIHEARRVRKAMGGGMRQAGYLAAAGIYALEHHIDRLAEDHEHARMLGDALRQVPWVKHIRPVRSNILLFDVADHLQASQVLQALNKEGIHASGFGPRTIRFVTHLDISREMIQQAIKAILQADIP
ncbi:MAG TPA: GntG family PLP-dependent aldolase [Saprospiraceae bacterium]|nr:GntG family PLP-dependent aldolase [Saprospiraceae bacterium]